MREMNNITLHHAFLAQECEGKQMQQEAVTVEAGATWLSTYDAVTTRGGRYVQGGGCLTVSVAGLIQSGGFGSFSKRYGLAAAGLLEAEIVTADGAVRIANAATNSDLFWGIKGGGGGSLGVVTKVTLKTHDLPKYFGVASGQIRASSDTAFRQLIGEIIAFYTKSLFNPHWGEQIVFSPDNTVSINMMFQGLDQHEAENVWSPFVEWLVNSAPALSIVALTVMCMPARHFWDSDYLTNSYLSTIVQDDRPSAPPTNIIWSGDQRRVGQLIHGYRSAWLPASLLQTGQQRHLADALFASTRHWEMCLHFNKGLAGASPKEITAAKDTPINPAVADAFALARCSAEGPPAFPGYPGREPDVAMARRQADRVSKAMDELLKVVPRTGSYVSESDFFESDWQQSFWGSNYPRLAAIKRKYDPSGLFYVHHGVGSEEWSADGFVRLRRP
jgi:FAD/FMN-containing dehydrogenase